MEAAEEIGNMIYVAEFQTEDEYQIKESMGRGYVEASSLDEARERYGSEGIRIREPTLKEIDECKEMKADNVKMDEDPALAKLSNGQAP
jgi:hypothetical protein